MGVIDDELLQWLKEDAMWLGMDIAKVRDREILIKWWNKIEAMKKGEKQNKRMDQVSAALWIRINQLHPKFLLRFDDIAHTQTA